MRISAPLADDFVTSVMPSFRGDLLLCFGASFWFLTSVVHFDASLCWFPSVQLIMMIAVIVAVILLIVWPNRSNLSNDLSNKIIDL